MTHTGHLIRRRFGRRGLIVAALIALSGIVAGVLTLVT
jgi:hypothetical protein